MRRRKNRCIIVALVMLLSATFVFGFGGAAQAANKTLKVGIIMPLSGPIGFVGVGLRRGVFSLAVIPTRSR
jgi:hypothetical protein